MVALQIVSDLHLEAPKSYDTFEITPKAPHLALLGDIGCCSRDKDELLAFLLRQLAQFKTVFFVLGNHEPYHSTWANAKNALREFEDFVAKKIHVNGSDNIGQLVFLDRIQFDLDDELHEDGGEKGENVTILGCTLFSRVPFKSSQDVGFGLNDFYHIRDWSVEAHDNEHKDDLAWLNERVKELEGKGRKIAILTHYSPTMAGKAVNPRHKDSKVAAGFATDLREEPCWKSEDVKLWAFGHTHYNCDFTDELGKRVCTNQRGYAFEQAPGFDVEKVVNI